MAYKIIYLPIAAQDLQDIAAYLSRFYKNTLPNFISELERSISNLTVMPNMGVEYKHFRSIAVSDYLIFYMVDDSTRTVRIYRILHGTRDIRDKLNS